MVKHDRGALIPRIKENGIQLHIWPYESPARPIYQLLKNCWKTSREFKEIAPDIIYSYHYSADYSEPLAARMAGIPWIYVKKNMSWYGPSRNAWFLRSLLARKINFQNNEMEKKFLHHFSKKLIRIPIGVDTERFKPRELAKNDKFTFIHISTLLPIKGVDVLLQAYKKFCSEIPENNHQLLVVGPDQEDHVTNIKNIYSHLPGVFFTGKRSDIPDLLNQADCFIQSSLNGEGAPIALQEAMSSGVVCIGSKVAGINDQLRGFEFLQYDSKNADELFGLMTKVYRMSPEERFELGMAFREKVMSEYSLELEINKTEEMMKVIIGYS